MSVNDKQAGLQDTVGWGAGLDGNPEADDYLHNPDPKRDRKVGSWSACRSKSRRTITAEVYSPLEVSRTSAVLSYSSSALSLFLLGTLSSPFTREKCRLQMGHIILEVSTRLDRCPKYPISLVL